MQFKQAIILVIPFFRSGATGFFYLFIYMEKITNIERQSSKLVNTVLSQSINQKSRNEEFHLSDSLGICIVFCQSIYLISDTIQHGQQHIFKLKIHPKLGIVDFCCKSLTLMAFFQDR